MSARALSLRRLGRAAAAKRKGKKKRARAAAPPTEYNMLLTATLCLLALGAVMVFSASSTTRVLSDGGLSDSAFYLKRTLIFGALGLLIMHLTARHGLDDDPPPHPGDRSSSRSSSCSPSSSPAPTSTAPAAGSAPASLQIQPSELAKVALILYGADLLARKPKRVRSLEGLMPFLLVVGAACLLIVAEPDLGTTMVIAFAVGATLIAAGARLRDLGNDRARASASSPC